MDILEGYVHQYKNKHEGLILEISKLESTLKDVILVTALVLGVTVGITGLIIDSGHFIWGLLYFTGIIGVIAKLSRETGW